MHHLFICAGQMQLLRKLRRHVQGWEISRGKAWGGDLLIS